MVVKSATKKRLTELGVREEHAHKLAMDRNMAQIKQLSTDEIAKVLGLSRDGEELRSVLAIVEEVGSNRRRSKSRKITISMKAIDELDMPYSETKFNVLNHTLVPHQELVAIENEEAELEPWGLIRDDPVIGRHLAKELLPKILITDPVVQSIKETHEVAVAAKAVDDPDYEGLPAGWLANRVIKVIRPSPSSSMSVAYRLIVEGN